jgi:Cu/Ag efflux protein CusF
MKGINMKITISLLVLSASLSLGAGNLAFAANDNVPVPAASATSTTKAAIMTDAEVRKIDKDAKKITLKHGEIKNLGMPAMTMVFQVKDEALLEKAKAGDKIKFSAEKIAGGYAVTAIEVTK